MTFQLLILVVLSSISLVINAGVTAVTEDRGNLPISKSNTNLEREVNIPTEEVEAAFEEEELNDTFYEETENNEQKFPINFEGVPDFSLKKTGNELAGARSIAEGIYGDVRWRVTYAGELRLGTGGGTLPGRDIHDDKSPWSMYADSIRTIIFDDPDGKKISCEQPRSTRHLFSGLHKVRSIENIWLLNTSKATDMSAMFSGMTSLTSLDLSSFDTSQVESTTTMFANTPSLTSLDLSSFDTSKVKYKAMMFYNMPNLSQITLGRKFKFVSGLPGVPVSDMYTGKWINVGSGSVGNPLGENIWTSEEMMTKYNGETDADTYVWQHRGLEIVTEDVDYSLGTAVSDLDIFLPIKQRRRLQ
ncbi:BspA family leucine-rich repeat surface protein [Lactococcus garvieae]|uniref:BspA family leucine-rich repeat surface protein n=1 Tax=Lactococcus garvieae TaxID=1363 RepID=UPI0021F8BB31|nr:BspA family leucine-rich repeat surface protein [Lactococcus garvieae]UYT11823.1 BspA family leucine-rich repeat surface protein [Lactococcus garvieae]